MITQLINKNGNATKNQFVITQNGEEIFQSYSTTIAKKVNTSNGVNIILDNKALEYSDTTSKYLAVFLGYDSVKSLCSDLDNFTFEDLN